jgi:hypothetical protein
MRFLKQQTLSRRAIFDTTVYSDTANANVYISPTGAGSLVLPNGTTTQRPSSPTSGMMRYNTTTNEAEIYQGSTWRALRFKEATQIVQQNLGAGDSSSTYFGPLNPAYYNPTNKSSDVTNFGAQNVLVYVENIPQLSGINYTVVQNPTIIDGTYTPTLSVAAPSGSTTLYFNTSANASGASWSGNVATLTFTGYSWVPFAVGATITVTGFTPSGYNGVFTVTASTSSSVSYALASNPGAGTVPGIITTSGTTNGYATFVASQSTTVTAGSFILGTTYTITSAGTTNFTLIGAANSNVGTSFVATGVGSGTGTATTVTGDISGATVTGTNIQASTIITAFTTDPNTDALTSITINKATTTSTLAVNTQITITSSSTLESGYYLQFTAPVPYGKTVIALLGFDQ